MKVHDPSPPTKAHDRRRRRLLLAAIAAAGTSRAAGAAGAHTEPPTAWVGDPIFLTPVFDADHPEQAQRVEAIEAALRASPLAAKVLRLRPDATPPAEVDAALRLIHTDAHVASIRSRYGERIDAVARAAVAATLTAVDAVAAGRARNAFVCSRPPGHHARNTGREEGFCFYNHVAVGVRHAQQRHGWRRVLVVDWDYHHGDGTEHFFYHDASVLCLSTHDVDAYPRTGLASRTGAGAGAGLNVNVPLPCGAADDDIVAAFERHLVPAATRFRPDGVLVSAGFDSRAGDWLGCFAVGDEGFARLTRIVVRIAAAHCHGRVVSVLEGGYQRAGLASAVLAHVQELAAR
jgi:acetoin utilization deacetylase AcuC-like enzyme